MSELIVFPHSLLEREGLRLCTGRLRGRDLILASGDAAALAQAGLEGGEAIGEWIAYPATYANMLAWERRLVPAPRLVALNRTGHPAGFGAGNRIVISAADGPSLAYQGSLGGWDGIYRALCHSRVPFWFIQQSIVRELIPRRADPAEHAGIGHTGGYGPEELLRAGLFAFASLGGYAAALPIGADADHAIVTGSDEESLARSLALNRLAIEEARDYTRFTVDTSHLFDFSVTLTSSERRRLLEAFRGRRFRVPNLLPGRPGFEFEFDEEEVLRLGRRYWRAAAVHRELYDDVVHLRGGEPFDYELSLDETPAPTPPRELLFYLVLLEEVMGLPAGAVTSVGPNIGFTKRHDYEGRLEDLWAQTNACASILAEHGAVLSVHSADGVRAATGKGRGVDAVLAEATGGRVQLKVADVYQELLWQVLARSPEPAEREVFVEAWRRTAEAVRLLGAIYAADLAGRSPEEVGRLLSTPAGQEQLARRHGADALPLVQGAAGYGAGLFRLAAELAAATDLAQPDPEAELFRRFMFLPYRSLRPLIFRTMTPAGWGRLAEAIEQATRIRLRAMGWEKEEADGC